MLRDRPGNSFAPGTQVLMADGTRKPIEKIRVGDRVWAADPRTGRNGLRRVTDRIVGSGTKQLVDLTIDRDGVLGGATARLTATANHRFWSAGNRDWLDARELAFGDLLTMPDGSRAMVVDARRYRRTLRVYNLTVDDIHTYYVAAGGADLLTHNCRDLDRHEQPPTPTPDPLRLGHTLSDHVNATDQLLAHAQDPKNKSKMASRWVDRQTVEQVIDYALADPGNQRKIQTWLRQGAGGDPRLPLSGQFGPRGSASLGVVVFYDGRKVAASNKYTIVLQRAPGHKLGYYIYTAYPEP
ncbi:RNase A-like domain-containing protein [Actinomadura keratinilytica]|uniref:Hint domain-containing protein n=1 Tax=Actinomadura keratinilytica TaxID=547461 RepID=A0ABP7Z4C0_9ACTN